jgi:HAD superfamily hydrolase (TIGR01509 family)
MPALSVLHQAGLLIGVIQVAELQAVFWDVDGTLADTELEGHRPAFNAAFREAGLDWHWDRTIYTELLAIAGGRQRMAAYAAMRGEALGDTRLDQLRALKQKHYLERSRNGAIGLRPGVARLITALQQAGVGQWIVTSSGAASVNALLMGVFAAEAHPFAGLISADDVAVAKPDPAPYQLALERSGLACDGVLAIEDSEAGLHSAGAAGLRCLLTPSPWEERLHARLRNGAPAGESNPPAFEHLGEAEAPARQWSGPPCPGGVVTLEYLQSLLADGNRS